MLQLLPPVDVAGNAGCLYGRHRMQLRGLLPPWVLSRLCAVLADSQDGQFQARSCKPGLPNTHVGYMDECMAGCWGS